MVMFREKMRNDLIESLDKIVIGTPILVKTQRKKAETQEAVGFYHGLNREKTRLYLYSRRSIDATKDKGLVSLNEPFYWKSSEIELCVVSEIRILEERSSIEVSIPYSYIR